MFVLLLLVGITMAAVALVNGRELYLGMDQWADSPEQAVRLRRMVYVTVIAVLFLSSAFILIAVINLF